MVLWELSARLAPYGNLPEIKSKFQLIEYVLKGSRAPIPSTCPKAFALLIQECWLQNVRTNSLHASACVICCVYLGLIPVLQPTARPEVRYIATELADLCKLPEADEEEISSRPSPQLRMSAINSGSNLLLPGSPNCQIGSLLPASINASAPNPLKNSLVGAPQGN